MGGVNNGWDLTDFRPIDADALLVNSPVNGTPFAAVQFETAVRGIVGMITGDSHQAGTSTQSQVNSFLLQYLVKSGQQQVGQVPVGFATDACGGLRSDEFFAKTAVLIDDVGPSFVVLPGWASNDHDGRTESAREIDQAFQFRLDAAVSQVEASGALPIFLTPFPRDRASLTQARLASWVGLRAAILDKRKAGSLVLDAGALLGSVTDGKLDGTYQPALTSDEVHPNDSGHAVLAAELDALLRRHVTAL